MIKNLVIALIVIVIIAAAGIYFLPNHYTLVNSVEINRPPSMVYPQVSNFNNWQAWSAWHEKEPDAKVTVTGEPGIEGQKMSWEGKEVGVGSMTLVGAAENESLVCSDAFEKPMEATSKDYWRFEANGDKTTVTWTTTGGLKYPFGRLFGLAVDKVVGATERKGLENLKALCEGMEIPALPLATTDSLNTVTP